MGAPALLEAQAQQILERLNLMKNFLDNQVQSGGLLTDGGTTQGSGAGTALNFDVDTSAITRAVVGGIPAQLGAGTDIDSDAGISFGATSGKTVTYAVVLECGVDNDTPALKAIPGAVYATGSEVGPTEAEIDAAVGHSNWVLLGDWVVNRTADTTVTFAADYSRVGNLAGGKLAGGSLPDFAETEADFRA